MSLPALHTRAARLGGHPGAADSPYPAAAAPARGRPICRAATVAAPPPPPATLKKQRWGGSGGNAASDALGAYTIPGSWQTYSRQMPGLPLSPVDAVLEQLRRQLGAGDRWAWQLNEVEAASEEESEDEAEAEEAEEAGSSSTSSSLASAAVAAAAGGQAAAVLSSRGAGRRSGSRRQCRGQALAGAAVYEQARPWAHASDPLPLELQACSAAPGLLLTAGQEALLGELVQAATRAQQPQQQPQQQEAALRRGSAARQLLFDCNLRLVLHTRRQLLGSVQLPASLHQELCNAGRDALWRAAGGYQPNRHTRFSTYASAAILNGLRDVLRQQQSQLVHVPRQARGWAAQVQAAAHGLQQQQAQQQQAAQQPPPRLEQLAAAAQLQPRQVLLGLAAARRQRLASFSCVVPVETAAGACSQNKQQQLAPFGDVQREEGEEAEDGDAAAAQEAVQLVLSRLRPSKHSQVLRLRFGLGDSSGTATAGEDVDFMTMGQQLGVSRQRAAQLYHAAVTSARQAAAASGMR